MITKTKSYELKALLRKNGYQLDNNRILGKDYFLTIEETIKNGWKKREYHKTYIGNRLDPVIDTDSLEFAEKLEKLFKENNLEINIVLV